MNVGATTKTTIARSMEMVVGCIHEMMMRQNIRSYILYTVCFVGLFMLCMKVTRSKLHIPQIRRLCCFIVVMLLLEPSRKV